MGHKQSVKKRPEEPPPVVIANNGLFEKLRRDAAGCWAGADQHVRQYVDEVKSVRSLDEWMSLNSRMFGDPLGGLDKSMKKFPTSAQFATGTIFGICSGFAARKAFRVGAVVVGAGFMSLQLLQYYGYITIEWKTIEQELLSRLDLNKDGRVDERDLEIAKQRFMKALTWGLPCAGGFTTGFLIGFRGRIL